MWLRYNATTEDTTTSNHLNRHVRQNEFHILLAQSLFETVAGEQYVELKLKYEGDSILDRTEDLMYRILATADSIKMRGHRVLVFQQADNLYQEVLSHSRFDPMRNRPDIIDGLAWRAVNWQHQQGVQPTIYAPGHSYVPPEMVHPMAGHHQILNEFLTNYIQEHKILA